MSLEYLPVDVIFNILKFLSVEDLLQVRSISPAWNVAVNDCRLWEHLTFTKEDPCELLEFSLLKAINVKSLHLRRCSRQLEFLSKLDPNMFSRDTCVSVEIIRCEVKPSEVAHICKLFKNLKQISFADSPILFPDCLKALSTLSHSLISLNLTYCCSLSDGDLGLIADEFPCLKELYIEGNSYISDVGIIYFLRNRAAELEVLQLDGENLTNSFIEQLTCCPNIREFSIAYSENIDSCGISLVFNILKKLRRLRFHKLCFLNDSIVASSIRKSPWLKELKWLELDDCQSLGDKTAEAISEVCIQLRHLSMDWWSELTDTGIQHIMEKCYYLEYLSLVGAIRIVGNTAFGPNLSKNNPRLRRLKLENCHRFNDSLFVTMLRDLPHLKISNYYGETFETNSVL